tara:strand:- start:629 stop:1552 length:924 start_codon:yes stop_codon:yes gene_type:complete
MSNTVIQQPEKFKFVFNNDLDRRILQDINEEELKTTILEREYFYCENAFKLVDYNTKGLLENITYTKMLIKKNLLNIPTDIYLEHIIKRLIHNYKFQIVNEFCLLKQFIEYSNTALVKQESDYYEHGINYAIRLFNFIKCVDKFVLDKVRNRQQSIEIEGQNWDYIFNYQIQEHIIQNKKEFIIRKNSQEKYKLYKICNKTIKVQRTDLPFIGQQNIKQIKKSDIQYVKIFIEEERTPYIDYCARNTIRQYIEKRDIFVFHNAESRFNEYDKFVDYCENKKDIINLQNILQYIKELNPCAWIMDIHK